MNLKNIKNFIILPAISIAFSTCILSNVFAANTLYENKTTETITKGVTYEKSIRVTDKGMQDVYVLTADISNPNITVGPASSTKDYGLRQNVLNLLGENGAVAGVNGDFFGVSTQHSASFGPVIQDGVLQSVSTGFNQDSNNFASFYIDKDNNPFILYLKTKMHFLNNGVENMQVYSLNKITDMVFPIVINSAAMSNTSSFDSRFPNTMKIVVENGVITYKSAKGETVNVPDDGYVVVIGEKSVDYFQQFYDVGQTADLTYDAGLDFTQIKEAIGGGGRLILNGASVSDDGEVITGRQPRTAVGISKDNSKIILMCVDGRGDSVGATNSEMQQLMLSYGAYNAMNLDGGGSTTMGITTPKNPDLTLVNTPSDGSMRDVMNSLAIYNNAPADSPMSGIKLDVEDGFVNAPLLVQAYGINDAYKRIDLDQSLLTLQSDDPTGHWDGAYFYPSKTGPVTFTATTDTGFSDAQTVTIRNLAELRPSQSSFTLVENGTANFAFYGISDMGQIEPVNYGVNYEVVPSTMGTVTNGTFTSTGTGSGYIKCTYGDISTYISIDSGSKITPIDSFETPEGISFLSYNGNQAPINGSVNYTSNTKSNGNSALQLNYSFPLVHDTQAAYLCFDKPIALSGNPFELTLDVDGDGSGNWVRGQIIDATGTAYSIDFAKVVDWTGFKETTATIPSGVKYPIVLSRLYLATTLATTANSTGTVYFDNLKAVVPIAGQTVIVPDSPKYSDNLQQKITTPPSDGSYDITVLGDWMIADPKNQPPNYNDLRNLAMYGVRSNSSQVIYAGETDYTTDIGTSVYQWWPAYNYSELKDVSLVQMTAAKGGFISTDSSQWTNFIADINASTKKNVMILVDNDPQKFNNHQEFQMFQHALEGFNDAGKNIFVISTEGSSTYQSVINGVRYINLGGLFKDNHANPDFSTLRFRLNGDNIIYDIRH